LLGGGTECSTLPYQHANIVSVENTDKLAISTVGFCPNLLKYPLAAEGKGKGKAISLQAWTGP
jgi:hypothetical protein